MKRNSKYSEKGFASVIALLIIMTGISEGKGEIIYRKTKKAKGNIIYGSDDCPGYNGSYYYYYI